MSILEIFQHEVYVNIVYGISALYLLHLPRPPPPPVRLQNALCTVNLRLVFRGLFKLFLLSEERK